MLESIGKFSLQVNTPPHSLTHATHLHDPELALGVEPQRRVRQRSRILRWLEGGVVLRGHTAGKGQEERNGDHH